MSEASFGLDSLGFGGRGLASESLTVVGALEDTKENAVWDLNKPLPQALPQPGRRHFRSTQVSERIGLQGGRPFSFD